MLTVLSRTSYVNLNLSRLKTTLLLLGITTLVACGGSSSESETPAQPVISQPPVTSDTPAAVQPLELPDVDVVVDENPISADTAVNEMGIGINLGNTLDAPTEGEWAPVAEEQVIIDFKQAGFKHVRIPVTWDNRTEKAAPYTIDTSEMDRVEEVVDWALKQDLYVILNVHHDDWLKKGDNTFTQENRNRFDAIWLQIVERFKNKPAKLLFEILNEPVDLTSANVDILNARVLEIIRRANPTRLVVFSGNDFTPLSALLDAAIPDTEDEYLIGNFHAYDPWPFAGQCLQRWGSESDKDELENIYKQAQAWSIENNIPVTVNEFGAAKFDFTAPENVCEQEDRLQYLESHVEFATKYGISATFWDDAGSFSSYDRVTGDWGPEKDILVAPNLPTLTVVEAENFQRYYDSTPGNEGSDFFNSTGDYVDGDVDIIDSDGQGQFVVGWTESGEWLEYDITLNPGTYIVSTSVSRNADDYSFSGHYSLLLDGVQQGSDRVDDTDSLLTFESHNVALTTVERGSYTLRLNINSGGFNIDKITFTPDDGSFVPTPTEQPLELPEVEEIVDADPILAKTAVAQMGIGINLGNGLDAPREGAWAAPKTEKQVIIDFKHAGFKHVRIPVTWDNRTARTTPYAVVAEEMDRIEEVIDWALDEDLYVILNVHHDYWFKRGDNTFTQNNRNRFDAIWLQIVERFKNKSAKLIFEILNQPEDLTTANVDQLNKRVLEIIRRVNPTRLVVFSGNGFTPLNALLSAAIPDLEDEYLIGNFHAYEPLLFARQCKQRWGSDSDKDALENVYIQAQSWSIENDIPVTINEFGAAKYDFTAPENICQQDDRLQYLETHVEFATKYGISATYWDDAEAFGIYDRISGDWGVEKDILVAPNLP